MRKMIAGIVIGLVLGTVVSANAQWVFRDGLIKHAHAGPYMYFEDGFAKGYMAGVYDTMHHLAGINPNALPQTVQKMYGCLEQHAHANFCGFYDWALGVVETASWPMAAVGPQVGGADVLLMNACGLLQ